MWKRQCGELGDQEKRGCSREHPTYSMFHKGQGGGWGADTLQGTERKLQSQEENQETVGPRHQRKIPEEFPCGTVG